MCKNIFADRSENVRGDINDVIKVARQSLNRCNASRVISKQECMVELTGLPLVICSETIENINISGVMKLNNRKSEFGQFSSIIKDYQSRSVELESCSLCEYIHQHYRAKHKEKSIIPHFIGMTSVTVYPPTVSYARATLIIHSPWRKADYHIMKDSDCITNFYLSIEAKRFPTSVILAYNKAKQQMTEGRQYLEPVQTQEQYEVNDEKISKEEEELIRAMTSITSNMSKHITLNGYEYNRGLNYNWSKRINNVSQTIQFKLYIWY